MTVVAEAAEDVVIDKVRVLVSYVHDSDDGKKSTPVQVGVVSI